MSSAAVPFKTGYVALIGEPNAGKSTLLNALLGQKISIVTDKPQTTRQRVLGILTLPDAQLIFLDTPGVLEPKYLLQETMMRTARRVLDDADVILVLTDAEMEPALSKSLLEVIDPLRGRKPILLAINKVDVFHRDRVLPLIAEMSRTGIFEEIIPISALRGENLDRLLETLKARLPEHPALYPHDLVSEQPERFFVAEIIREKIFEMFHDEVPYSTAVEIREYKERDEGKTYISADIIVERDSQKGILIGKRGAALKGVGQRARKEIEEFTGRQVFLDLFVKVGEKWRKSASWLRRLGYEE